jgi:two-component system response regulator YesN
MSNTSDKYMEDRTVCADSPTSPLNMLLAVVGRSLFAKRLSAAVAELRLDGRLARAWLLIEQSYSDEGLTLAGAARVACISKNQLERLFAKKTGHPFHQMLILYRILQAAQMLAAGNLSVTDVAGNVGFRSLDAFRHSFRKAIGVTPQEFKKICSAIKKW